MIAEQITSKEIPRNYHYFYFYIIADLAYMLGGKRAEIIIKRHVYVTAQCFNN